MPSFLQPSANYDDHVRRRDYSRASKELRAWQRLSATDSDRSCYEPKSERAKRREAEATQRAIAKHVVVTNVGATSGSSNSQVSNDTNDLSEVPAPMPSGRWRHFEKCPDDTKKRSESLLRKSFRILFNDRDQEVPCLHCYLLVFWNCSDARWGLDILIEELQLQESHVIYIGECHTPKYQMEHLAKWQGAQCRQLMCCTWNVFEYHIKGDFRAHTAVQRLHRVFLGDLPRQWIGDSSNFETQVHIQMLEDALRFLQPTTGVLCQLTDHDLFQGTDLYRVFCKVGLCGEIDARN